MNLSIRQASWRKAVQQHLSLLLAGQNSPFFRHHQPGVSLACHRPALRVSASPSPDYSPNPAAPHQLRFFPTTTAAHVRACATPVYPATVSAPSLTHLSFRSPLAHYQCDPLDSLAHIADLCHAQLPISSRSNPLSIGMWLSSCPPQHVSQSRPARPCTLPQPGGSVPDGGRPPLSVCLALALSTLNTLNTLTTTGLWGSCTHVLGETFKTLANGPLGSVQLPPLRFSYHPRPSIQTNSPSLHCSPLPTTVFRGRSTPSRFRYSSYRKWLLLK